LLRILSELKLHKVDRIRAGLKGTRGCRVEIRRTDHLDAAALAKKLCGIFDSCGYPTRVLPDPDAHREGVHLKSHPKHAASALAIQSAFHSADIDCLLSIEDNLPPDAVILHIGANALAH